MWQGTRLAEAGADKAYFFFFFDLVVVVVVASVVEAESLLMPADGFVTGAVASDGVVAIIAEGSEGGVVVDVVSVVAGAGMFIAGGEPWAGVVDWAEATLANAKAAVVNSRIFICVSPETMHQKRAPPCPVPRLNAPMVPATSPAFPAPARGPA